MKNIGNINNKNIGALLNSSNIYYEGGGKTLNNIIYPVGSVIIRVDSVNPSTWYGGTWELLCPGRTLVCIDTGDGDFNTVKKTGGEKSHSLTRQEIPRITGQINFHGSGSGGTVVNNTSGDFISNNILNGYFGGSPIGGSVSVGLVSMDFGGNGSHNNLQPYMVVYIWVRTA